jgi:hypothetical protein
MSQRLTKKHISFLPDFIREDFICCPECGCGKEDESTFNTEYFKCSKCSWKDSWGKTINHDEWINKDRYTKLKDILTE